MCDARIEGGDLKTSTGKAVKSRKQTITIALREAEPPTGRRSGKIRNIPGRPKRVSANQRRIRTGMLSGVPLGLSNLG